MCFFTKMLSLKYLEKSSCLPKVGYNGNLIIFHMGKRGPKPQFLDVACPNNICEFFGLTGHGNVVGNGTCISRGEKTRRYICRHCGKIFNDHNGSSYYDLRKEEHIIDLAIKMFMKDMSVKAIADVLEIEPATVCRWLGRAGISEETIIKGYYELQNRKPPSDDKIHPPGGGRKKSVEKDPTLLSDLETLIEPTSHEDPESPLFWTSKSTRMLTKELKKMGHKVSNSRVGDILHMLGYSLQANKKTTEENSHPDCDKQFNHIYEKCKEFQKENQPVISVEAKKKELDGNFKNEGKGRLSKKDSLTENIYDFEGNELGKVNPCEVYDLFRNKGWVNIGIDNDTTSFAVECIRRWWNMMGCEQYPEAKILMITAECGVSNGDRVRLWKIELQKLADEIGLEIFVCHFPPGTSKWNKIENRLISQITSYWRGKPLTSYEVIVKLIAATITLKGLKVKCMLDKNEYPKGIKITKEEVEELGFIRDEFYGECNYTFRPRSKNIKEVIL
ncbi:Transposase [Methanosarcina mazei TMA]|nr:Transposase [Methanosarcina mazei TMA]